MADDKIVQQVQLEGTEDVQRKFQETGTQGERAFKQIGEAANNTKLDALNSNLGLVGDALRNLQGVISQAQQSIQSIGSGGGEGLNEIKTGANDAAASLENLNQTAQRTTAATQQAAGAVNNFSGNMASIALKIGAVVGTLIGFVSSIDSIRKSLEEIQKVGALADKAKIDLNDFRELEFILKSIGASSEDARKKIEDWSGGVDNAGKSGEKFSDDTKKVIDSLNALARSGDGATSIADKMVIIANAANQANIPVDALEKILAKFKDASTPEEIEKMTEEINKLKGVGEDFNVVFGKSSEIGKQFGNVILVPKDARSDILAVVEAYKNFLREVSPENFAKVVEAIASVNDEAKRGEVLAKLFGEEIGGNLKRKLESLQGGESPIKAIREEFERMGIALPDAAQKISEDFAQAMVKLSTALQRGREQMALLFGPGLTEGANKFAELIRGNQSVLQEFVSFIAEKAVGALQQLIGFFSGSTPGLDAGGDPIVRPIDRIKEALTQLGNAVQNIITGIIIPAFQTLVSAASGLAETINEALGTKLTGTDVALVGILAALLGGVNSLAVAFLALFNQTGPGFEKMKTFFSGFGIDIQKIITDIQSFLSGAWKQLIDAFQGRSANDPNTSFTWADDLVIFLKSTPGLILEVIAALAALRIAAARLAPFMSKLFGKEVSGDALLTIGVLGQLTGALGPLLDVVKTVSGVFGAIGVSVIAFARILELTLIPLLGSAPVAIGILIAALLLLGGNLDKVDAFLKIFGVDLGKTFKQIDDLIQHDFNVRPLEGLAKLFNDATGSANEFFDTMSKGGGIIEALAQNISRDLGPAAGEALRRMAADAKNVGWEQALKNEILRELGEIATDFNKTFGPGGELDQTVGEFIVEFVKKWTGIDLGAAWTNFKVGWNGALDIMGQKFDAWIEGIKLKAQAFFDFLKSWVPGFGKDVDDAQKKLDELKPNDRVKQDFDALGNKVDEVGGKMQALPTDIGDTSAKLLEATGNAGSLSTETGNATNAADQTKASWQSVVDTINQALESARQLANTPAPQQKDRFQNLPESTNIEDRRNEGFNPQQIVQDVQTATNQIIEFLGQSQNEVVSFAKSVVASVQNELTAIVQGTNGTLQSANSFLSALRTTFEGLVQSLKGLAGAFDELSTKIAASFGIEAVTAFGTAVEVMSTQAVAALQTIVDKANEAADALARAKSSGDNAQQTTGTPTLPSGGTPTLPSGGGQGLLTDNLPESTNIEDRRAGGIIEDTLNKMHEVQTAIGDLVKSFQSIPDTLSTAFSSITEPFTRLVDAISQANAALQSIAAVLTADGSAFQQLADLVTNFINLVTNSLQQVSAALTAAFDTGPLFAFGSAIQDVSNQAVASLQAIIDKAREAAAAVASVGSGSPGGGSGGSSDSGGSGEGFAEGGLIGGKPGRDKNLIWASRDEFMMQVKAVQKYGVGFMHAVNSGQFNFPKFDAGGLIGALAGGINVSPTIRMPSMPSGGTSDQRERIDLGLGGGVTIPVTVTSDVASGLRRLAVHNKMNSAGATPR